MTRVVRLDLEKLNVRELRCLAEFQLVHVRNRAHAELELRGLEARLPLLDVNSANPLESSIARLRGETS